MKRPILAPILAGLVLLTGLGFAVRPASRSAPPEAQAMAAANELVAAGHYAEAAQMYEQMAARGAQDAALYYNLGNATFLLGDAERAVAAYEQAAALAPRDADIRANLALAQREARGRAGDPSANPLGALAGVTSRWLTVDELALAALGAWFALGLLLFVYLSLRAGQHPAVLRAAMAVALIVVLATGGALASRIAEPPRAAPAAMLDQQAAAPAGLSAPM